MVAARAAIVGAVLLLAPAAYAQDLSADGLAPQDRLSVKVLQWLPGKGEYKEWTAVGGEYTVAADGSLGIPFAGPISAGGQSSGAVAEEIASALQVNLSLPTKPDVRMEVLQRGPVYVLGGVETPGKVDFAPGMTAIEAIALAGGFYRTSGGQLRLERDVINAQGDLDTARQAAARLTARIARLEAEQVGEAEVDMPDTQSGFSQDLLAPFVEEEQGLLQVRKQALDSQLESLRSRQELATQQTKTLSEKANNLERQVQLARDQLANVQSLVGKGLTVASREFDLERTLSAFQGQLLDVQSARLAADLEINAAQRDQVDALTAFKTEVASSLQTARESLEKARIDMGRAEMLIREATVITPQMLVDEVDTLGVNVRLYRSRKDSDGEVQTTEIDRDERLRSGDTLQVQLETRPAAGLPADAERSANPS